MRISAYMKKTKHDTIWAGEVGRIYSYGDMNTLLGELVVTKVDMRRGIITIGKPAKTIKKSKLRLSKRNGKVTHKERGNV